LKEVNLKMGASSSSDAEKPANQPEEKGEPLKNDPNFNGPVEQRKPKDVLFALLLVVGWMVMTVLGGKGWQEGDVDQLLNGMDYTGKICKDDTSKLFYVNKDLLGVCVSSCPTATSNATQYGTTFDASTLNAITSCTYAEVAAGTCAWSDEVYCIGYTGSLTMASAVGSGDNVCMIRYKTKDIMNRCIFADKDVYDSIIGSQGDTIDYAMEFLSDVFTARAAIFGFGFPVTIVLGFVFLLVLRMPGILPIIIWSTVLSGAALLIAMGAYSAAKAQEWEEQDPREKEDYQIKMAEYMGYVFCGLTVIYLCLVIYMRSRVALAIGLLKEAARAIACMPALVFFPLIQAASFVVFMVFWMIYATFIASTGEVEQKYVSGSNTPVKTFSFDKSIQYQGWYMIFMFFWTTQFIVAMGQLVIAMSVATWYFTRDKSTIGSGTMWKSLKSMMIFHTGTAAFGSLIIAIVQTIRAYLSWLQKQAKDSGNKVAEYVLCICQCCLWCLEKCLKFLNKNAYIQAAIFNYGFCKSAKEAFFLILRNAARVFAVTVVGSFICLLGKFFICGAATAGSYFIMAEVYGDEMTGYWLPALFVFAISWFVADFFLDIYGMAVSTLLQCFIADEEMYPPDQRFAENSLAAYVKKYGSGLGKQDEKNDL